VGAFVVESATATAWSLLGQTDFSNGAMLLGYSSANRDGRCHRLLQRELPGSAIFPTWTPSDSDSWSGASATAIATNPKTPRSGRESGRERSVMQDLPLAGGEQSSGCEQTQEPGSRPR